MENNHRQSISSEITLIDEQDSNLYNNHLSPIINNDEATLSINSTSPMDQSVTMSTSDYPTRSNYSKTQSFLLDESCKLTVRKKNLFRKNTNAFL